MPSLKDFLFGKEEKIKKLPTMSGEQNQLFSQLLQALSGSGGGFNQSLGLLQQYLNPESDIYKNFEQPYLDEFNQETVPQLAERFAGLGGGMGGGLSSSGFGQSLGTAGASLQTQLAGMKSGIQRQSIQDILGLGQGALSQQPFAYLQKQASPGFWAQAAGAALKSGAGGM